MEKIMTKHTNKPFSKTINKRIFTLTLVALIAAAATVSANGDTEPVDENVATTETWSASQIDTPKPVDSLVNDTEVNVINFQDVPAFYAPAVDYMLERNVTRGKSNTEFGTTENIIRADAAVWLAKELDLDTESAPASGFKDIPVRAQGAVDALKHAGFINGKTADQYGANAPLTRGEIALILQRAYGLKSDGTPSYFSDVSDRYDDAVGALVANEITNGISASSFGVNSDITRGQLAVFVHRLSKLALTPVPETTPEPAQELTPREEAVALLSKTMKKSTYEGSVSYDLYDGAELLVTIGFLNDSDQIASMGVSSDYYKTSLKSKMDAAFLAYSQTQLGAGTADSKQMTVDFQSFMVKSKVGEQTQKNYGGKTFNFWNLGKVHRLEFVR